MQLNVQLCPVFHITYIHIYIFHIKIHTIIYCNFSTFTVIYPLQWIDYLSGVHFCLLPSIKNKLITEMDGWMLP